MKQSNWMAWAAAMSALLAVLALVALDTMVAQATAGGAPDSVWSRGTALLDVLSLKNISNFLLGPVLLLAAIILLVMPSMRDRFAWPLVYVGAVQSLSTMIADFSKPLFGRARPFEAAADIWFTGANSFPSGHTAFYAGLFFPLIILFPRWSPLLVIPPLFVATSRVIENDHYVSDVAASLALAAALAAALAFLARRGDARAR